MKQKKNYIINLIGILILYGILSLLIGTRILSSYYTGIIIMILINILLAVSLNLATGFLGQLVLGHAGFMSIGAYTAAIISTSLGINNGFAFIGILIAGGLVAGIIGLIIGIPALRLRGDYLAIITLSFGEIIRILINNMEITGGAKGMTGITRLTSFHVAFWVVVASIAIMYTLIHSRHGRAIISVRENEIAAESVGISTTYYKSLAFSIAAFFAGVAGGLYAHHLRNIMPEKFDIAYSVDILVIVVLGGMGSFTGSIFAAIVLTILPEALREFNEWRLFLYAILLIVMMIFKPEGLFGMNEIPLTKALRWIKGKISPSTEGRKSA